MECHAFRDFGAEISFFAKHQRSRRAGIDTSGLCPAFIQQVGAAGALLSDVEALVIVDGAIRTGINAVHTPRALLGVDDNQPVVSLVYAAFHGASRHTGGIFAVLAHHGNIGHFYVRNVPSNEFILLQPELPGVGLRFGVRAPIIPTMLILASNLAVVTPIALCGI